MYEILGLKHVFSSLKKLFGAPLRSIYAESLTDHHFLPPLCTSCTGQTNNLVESNYILIFLFIYNFPLARREAPAEGLKARVLISPGI